MEPVFFTSPAAWRAWLQKNHRAATEAVVGYHKVDTGKPSMTWSESVDEAVCFGWIDGVRRSLGPDAYCIRFTPRKPGSNWSKVNVMKVQKAIASGCMRPAGLAAFAARTEAKTGVYSFEREHAAFTRDQDRTFRRSKTAWTDWQSRPASYRKAATHWVTSAKKKETRQKRFTTLVEASARGVVAPPFKWATKRTTKRTTKGSAPKRPR